MVGIYLFPEPGPSVAPQLIASNSILQLSTVELEQAIIRELDENPALEMVERHECPMCGSNLTSGLCQRCSGSDFSKQATSSPSAATSSSPETDWSAQGSQEGVDPLGYVATPLSLAEALFAQLRLTLAESEFEIALHVVGNLNEHGYLTVSIDELVETLHTSALRIEEVVKELQHLEPAGIGAHNVQECLLLQLERLVERGATPPAITRTVIERYLTELGHHQFESIHTNLHVSRTEIEDTFLFIRANFHPYPAYHYFAAANDPSLTREQLVPTVFIHRRTDPPAGYDVEVVESQRFLLSLNPAYRQIRQQQDLMLSPGELEHVAHFLERARLFMSQIQRRTTLLRRLMRFLVEYQSDFLDRGTSYLRPLSQKVVAQELGVHVSTISRAIANKYAQLPSRELIPLHRFFSGELRTQEIIRQMIAQEKVPLSDAAIAQLLREHHNVTLSRQMVANYRVELGIPAARQRAVLARKLKETR